MVGKQKKTKTPKKTILKFTPYISNNHFALLHFKITNQSKHFSPHIHRKNSHTRYARRKCDNISSKIFDNWKNFINNLHSSTHLKQTGKK